MSREKVIKTEYHVHRFMYGLGIKGSTLQVYAALYSFTLGERGLFHGSIGYLAASLMISERTVNRAYKRLRELGLIEDYESRDGRFKGVRCVNGRAERATSANINEEKSPAEHPYACDSRGSEEKRAESTEAADEGREYSPFKLSDDEHSRHVRELCERINAKIKAKGVEEMRAESEVEDEAIFFAGRRLPPDLPEHKRNTIRMMNKYERSGDNRQFLRFGRSGGVRMTEPQYKNLLAILPTEELTPYLVKLENMLDENVKTGKKPPHSHYKTLKKWIEEDVAL